jgi:hypothetical protein
MQFEDLLDEKRVKIFCDLDGVLTDFEKQYIVITGETTKEAEDQGWDYFWQPVDEMGASFWGDMEWTGDGKKLWNYIKQYDAEILTATSQHESSSKGKHIWLDRELPGVKKNIVRRSEKQNYAWVDTDILIDDTKRNIDEWEDVGGTGILHINTEDTIRQLKELGL